MTIDPKAFGAILQTFASPVIAITSRHDGRDNGLIVISGGPGSILMEAPRITVGVSKPNLTHDMITASKLFTLHLLRGDAEGGLTHSVALVQELGGHSGREHDKLSKFATRRGANGCLILTDALLYAECRVANTMDAQESTVFLADVTACERLAKGAPLTVPALWSALPEEWKTNYNRAHDATLIAAARRARGLA